MEIDEQLKLVEEIKTRPATNVVELCIKIWTETALSPRLMVLPFDMVEQAENPPNIVSNISEGVKDIGNNLKMTSTLQSRDAFFFRMGII